MICSICNQDKKIIAYRVRINDEIAIVCIDCFEESSPDHPLASWVGGMVMAHPDADHIVGIDFSHIKKE